MLDMKGKENVNQSRYPVWNVIRDLTNYGHNMFHLVIYHIYNKYVILTLQNWYAWIFVFYRNITLLIIQLKL